MYNALPSFNADELHISGDEDLNTTTRPFGFSSKKKGNSDRSGRQSLMPGSRKGSYQQESKDKRDSTRLVGSIEPAIGEDQIEPEFCAEPDTTLVKRRREE